MIKKILAVSISLAFFAAPSLVSAKGNASAGKEAAANCASCHGEDGNSMAGNFPKLAGQHASYLVKQLQAFKDNSRIAPMMAPLALGLSKSNMEDIAAFYASKRTSSNEPPLLFSDDDDDEEEEKSADELAAEVKSLIALGADIYLNGNLKTEVSACIACHGPHGEGNKPSSFPALRGQHADYLINTLTDFKKGKRNVDSDNMMHMIAKKMSEKEIQALSYYISVMK